MKTAYIKNFEQFSSLLESYQAKLNECLAVAGNIDNTMFLFKNRDRSFKPHNLIIHEKINDTEIIFYSDQSQWIEGMNEYGVGFVFSALSNRHPTGYLPSWYMTNEPKDGTSLVRFKSKIKNALLAKTADDIKNLIIDTNMNGSYLISDSKKSYELEIYNNKFKERDLDFSVMPYYIKTNHGNLFPDAGSQEDGYSIRGASSRIRQYQGYSQIANIKSVDEIPGRLKFQLFAPSSPLNVFRTDDEENTISQCLMNLTDLKFYFYHDDLTAQSCALDNRIKDPKISLEIIKYVR